MGISIFPGEPDSTQIIRCSGSAGRSELISVWTLGAILSRSAIPLFELRNMAAFQAVFSRGVI